MAEQIVFYGKGGTGKSTVISNVSAALVEVGFRVLQVGCDQKADSCHILNGGFPIPTVSQQHERYGFISFDSVLHRGFKGVFCVELGCRAAFAAVDHCNPLNPLDLLLNSGLITALSPDFVLYDASGEDSCRAIHARLQKAGANRAYIVTSGDYMSLYSANSILAVLTASSDTTGLQTFFGGFIPNGIANTFEESFIGDFAKHASARTLGRIPRSQMVRQCELYGKTVIEAAPFSNHAYYYRRLANRIVDEAELRAVNTTPKALTDADLRHWACEWADRLFALENGLVSDGAAI